MAVRVLARSASSSTIRTRSREPANQIAPSANPVAGILKDQCLRADLHALRLVGALGDMRTLALLRVDRRDGPVLALYEIHPCNDAEPL